MLSRLCRLAGDLVSPVGERSKLTVLMYHRTPAEPDPLLPEVLDAAAFGRHMALLARNFNVMALREACARLANGTLPSRAACITFDDGYADNERIALPILKRLGVPATFFVATGYMDGGIMFNDAVIEAVRRAPAGQHDLSALGLGRYVLNDVASRRAAIETLIAQLKYRAAAQRSDLAGRLAAAMSSTLPRDLMMTARQIKRLHDEGMEIGGHTVSHPILALLGDDDAQVEITDGKRRLEQLVGAPVTSFAYPNGRPGGDYGPRDVRLVRDAGFTAAVSTVSGVASRGSDLFQLPRFGPWDRHAGRLGVRLLVNCLSADKRRRPALAS
ncbi:MAG: polysaccharide deacetylase family protein [Rhodospirillaceae bacterium]